MIELGQFTKDLDDTGYIGVKLRDGEVVFARPIISFPMIGVPTEDWLNSNGSKFMAAITYEKGQKERPLLCGLVPLKNTDFPSEGYENNYFFYGKNFRVWINDDDNKLVLDVLNNGEIMLGNKNVTEPAILGDKWKTFMETLIDLIAAITVVSPVGTTSTPVNATAITALKNQLQQLLSETVKLK